MIRDLPRNLSKLSKCLRDKTVDPVTITKSSLQLAEHLKFLNAFIRLVPEYAIREAEKSAERYKNDDHLGSFDGAPIAIKDNFCTNGIHTTCAAKMLESFVPAYNATVYQRLKNRGAVLVGKTNLDQYGMGSGTVDSIFGPTQNPWSDDFRIAGGSSGGSAVAVASGICYGALGSDTGGSTRNPASYCGVVGFKPTYGLVSRHGLIPLVNSMDVPGIITRNVDDCVTMLNAIAGPDHFDSTTLKIPYKEIKIGDNVSVKGLKIGIPKEYHCKELSPEVLDVWTKVADLLEDAGAQVRQVSLPNTSSSIFVYSILNQCEVASNMARYDGIEYGHRSNEDYSTEQLYAKSRAEGFNSVVKNRILGGNFFLLRRNYEKYFLKALRVRRLIANDFDEAFKSVDLLLTPTTLTDAPVYEDFIQSNNRDQCAIQDFCTQPANMGGIPALTLPITLSSQMLPLSLQLMGSNLSEELLFRVAKWIEGEVGFVEKHYN